MNETKNIRSYRDLIVWQKAVELVVLVYDITDDFPSDERFNLTSQMRRAAVSVPSNLAEGSRRGTAKDYRHFVLNSYGSGAELETQYIVAKRRHYIKNETKENIFLSLLEEVMKMLNTLEKTLNHEDK